MQTILLKQGAKLINFTKVMGTQSYSKRIEMKLEKFFATVNLVLDEAIEYCKKLI